MHTRNIEANLSTTTATITMSTMTRPAATPAATPLDPEDDLSTLSSASIHNGLH